MRYNTHIKMTDIDDKLSRVGKVRSQTPIMYMKNGDKKECIFPLQQQRKQFGVYLMFSH